MNKACRPFEKEEIALMFEGFKTEEYGNRDRAIFAVGISTGFRINEILSLRVKDVYNEIGDPYDKIKVQKRNMKGGKSRPPKKIFPETKLYLSHWYDELMRRWAVHRSSKCFMSEKGGAISAETFRVCINRVCKKVGIETKEIGTHSMRKTFANAVYDYWVKQAKEGRRIEPMRMVQIELAHSNIDDTYRYLNFKLEEKGDDVFHEYNMLAGLY